VIVLANRYLSLLLLFFIKCLFVAEQACSSQIKTVKIISLLALNKFEFLVECKINK